LGAFALDAGSKDSVWKSSLGGGVFSVVVAGENSESGRALAEVYDANLDSAESLITNLSVRALVESGETFIVGFVIGGNRELNLVIRAIGPGLAAFGISNPMENPSITVYSDSTEVAANDDWRGEDGRALGAFPLEPGSKDSVVNLNLSPGVYTAHVTSAENGASDGVLLLELYDAN
jgi:hypothetical protein